MTTLVPGQVIGVADPQLVAMLRDGGFLTDCYSLQYQVFEVATDAHRAVPAQVWPVAPGTKASVDVRAVPLGHRLGLGRFAAVWTVPSSPPAAAGFYLIRWYCKLTETGTEFTWDQEFEVQTVAMRNVSGYCLVADLRAQGVTDVMASTVRLQTLILEATRFIEMATGRTFGPRYMTFSVDGRGHRLLLLHQAIVAVENVVLAEDYPAIDGQGYRVYNRAIAQNLLTPDDRNDPRLELIEVESGDEVVQGQISNVCWPRGAQNIAISGVWGYTDPDGSPMGCIPSLIKRATILLVYRALPLITDEAGRDAQVNRFRVTSESTRGQSVSFGQLSSGGGASGFTGDPEIDGIIAAYRRPPVLGAA